MNLLYTLIIVTQAGAVHLTPGIKSLEMCEDARQIAETGRTVAGEKQFWHERSLLQAGSRPGELTAVTGAWRTIQSSDPKYAKCVIMPEDQR